MTPAASARVKAPPPKTRASASQRTAPARRTRIPGGPVPRRVSGPMAPRPSKRSSKQAASERLGAFLRSLPDHSFLDRLVRGRVWIPLLGVMLVGIVAMQVELLKLNASTGRSIELISSLQSRNESLRVDVASASNPNRIERIATGMGMPGPESITFLSARSASAQRALAGMRPPDVAAFEAALPADSATASTPTASAPTTTTTPRPQTNTTAQTATTSQATTTSQTNTTPQTTSTTAALP
jgi:cell division protein FtsL